MLLKKYSKDAKNVSKLKKRLIELGFVLDDTGANKGVFGAKVERAVKQFQKEKGLVVDGQVGTMTWAALNFEILQPDKPKPVPPQEIPDVKGKPFWVKQMESRLGWTEFSHDKEIAKDWHLAGLPQYKSVIGRKNAWCGLACEIALRSGGLKGPKGSAAAASWSNFGEECDPICGAFAPIRHAGGGRHICVFLYWKDEAKQIAVVIGGNQSNAYTIMEVNLSGNKKGKDQIIGGFRWPKGYPKTDYKYPPKANIKKGGSTR